MTSATTHESAREPIAIIGIGCHLPGGATDPATFWDLMVRGVDATREVPEDRWEVAKFYDPDNAKLGKMATFRGGFLDRVDEFDPQFFGISPREAIWIDPQQRLLLRTAWEAMDEAGLDVDALAGSPTGVFIGGFTLDYQLLQNYGVQSRYELQAHSATGMMMTMLSNRLSYAFDFRGPSLSVDTACSGSLVAVHLAAQAIWNGECSLALAGGVNVMLAPNMTIAESKGGFLAADGRCKTFSAAADGYARGEGAGVVVLKPLAQARADGDRIYAAVLGTAVSQDGHTNGITVPNGDSQAAAMRAAYARAGVAAKQAHYVEAHGTGTPIGDPIEAAAIARVVGEGRDVDDPIVIGSVKTNVGHLEAAAGVTGLIKTALILKHGRIPGNLHFTEPNPAIAFDELRLRVPTRTEEWPSTGTARYAGVNSFGFGGTNAHVVLTDVEDQPTSRLHPVEDTPRVLPISARSPEALRDVAQRTATFLRAPELALEDAVHSLVHRRTHHEFRAAVVASSAAGLAEQLEAVAGDQPGPGLVTGRTAPDAPAPKLAFVCTGMGPQWWGMARGLLETEPVFREAVHRCDRELAQYTGWSLLEEMLTAEEDSRMGETEIAQPANFAVQIALAELWASWGITPDAIIGHSTGEVAAQYLAGVLSFEDAIKVTYYRSSLQQRATGTGKMLAVGLTAETLDKAVADAGPTVSVAAVNGPSSVTLAGDETVLQSMADQLETFGVFHKFLTVKVPYHSHCMDPLREDLLAGLADLQPRPASIPLYSTVTGTRIDGRSAGAGYWWQNVRATVLFQTAFEQMLADGYTQFLEIGPHPVLATAMREVMSAAQVDGILEASMRRGADESLHIRQTLGALHCHGHRPDLDVVNGSHGSFVSLPAYPWQLRRYWNESREAVEDRHYLPVHPLLGQRLNAPHPTWEHEVNPARSGYLGDHKIQGTVLMPAAGFIDMAFAAAAQAYGDANFCIEDLDLRRALVLAPTADPRLRSTLDAETGTVEFASLTPHTNGDRTWVVHATARIGTEPAFGDRADLPGLVTGLHRTIGREEFYDLTRALGFEYGPTFQTVDEVEVGPGLAVASISASEHILGQLPAHVFHPTLIDAAFQVLITAAVTQQEDGQAAPFLPVGVDRITIHGRATERMHVLTRIRRSTSEILESDISVYDTSGTCLLQIDGFRAQSLESAMAVSGDRIDAGLLNLVWQELDGTSAADDGDIPEPGVPADRAAADVIPLEGVADAEATLWVVFADRGGFGEQVAAAAAATGQRTLTVKAGDVDRLTPTSSDTCLIDPADAEQYSQLVAGLGEETITKIVHLWALDAEFTPDAGAEQFEPAHTIGILSVTKLLQALSNERSQLPQIWLCTRGAVSAMDSDRSVNLASAPLWGLGRVIGHQEFTTMWGGIVDLEPRDLPPAGGQPANRDDEQLRMLVADINDSRGEDQLAYRAGRRLGARLRPVSGLGATLPTRLRSDATYLVTGALGALGTVVTKFLVDHGARHLTLVGRTALPDHAEWADLPPTHPARRAAEHLRTLRASGIDAQYIALDVSDRQALASWADAHRAEGRPAVRGVVHVAGAVDDQLLVKMTEEQFRRVLRPKVVGGWNLHQQFLNEGLDFFVLFSSTGSVIASAGQANYASANAFLDALGQHRRALGLPGTAIGWGPWSVGMVEDLNLEQLYQRRGIELITPEVGVQVLRRLLPQKQPHYVAITADWAKARETGLGGTLPAMFTELGASSSADADSLNSADDLLNRVAALDPEGQHAEISGYLRGVVMHVMGLDADSLDDNEALSGLGMDSMMAIEAKHRLEAAVRVEVSVLDLMQGATVASLAEMVLAHLNLGAGSTGDATEREAVAAEDASLDERADATTTDDELERLLATLDPDELERLLADIESDPHGRAPDETHNAEQDRPAAEVGSTPAGPVTNAEAAALSTPMGGPR